MKKVSGQSYVIEFVLLGFIGILVFIGVFSFYEVALDPLYSANIEYHASYISHKLKYVNRVFYMYDVDEGEFKIEIPQRLNNNGYSLRESSGGILVFVGDDYYWFDPEVNYRVHGVILSNKGYLDIYYLKGRDYVEIR